MDWRKIKAEYIAGGTSLRKLAEKYGVSFSTIQKKSMEEKWGNLRKKNRRKVEEKIIDSVSSKEAKKAVDIIDVADKLLDKISDLMDAIPLDTQSMKHLTSALKDLKEIKGFKTDADMREQEARIRNLERQAEADNASKDIEVQFGSEAEEYSR